MSRCALSCVGIVSPDRVEDAIRVEKVGTKEKNWEREKEKDTDRIIEREGEREGEKESLTNDERKPEKSWESRKRIERVSSSSSSSSSHFDRAFCAAAANYSSQVISVFGDLV